MAFLSDSGNKKMEPYQALLTRDNRGKVTSYFYQPNWNMRHGQSCLLLWGVAIEVLALRLRLYDGVAGCSGGLRPPSSSRNRRDNHRRRAEIDATIRGVLDKGSRLI
jgi:hypothetical protein